MDGFDYLGAFDYGSLLKGAGGLLSSFGSPQGAGNLTPDQQKQLQRAQEEKAKAEASARKLKIGLGIGGAVAAFGTIVVILARR